MNRRQWLAVIMICLLTIIGGWLCRGKNDIELPPPPPNVDSIKAVYDSAMAVKVAEVSSKQVEIEQLSMDKALLTVEVSKAKQAAQTWKRRYEQERKNKDTAAALASCDSLSESVEKYMTTVTAQLIAADSIIGKQSAQIERQNKILHQSEKQIALLDSSIRGVVTWNRKLVEQLTDVDRKRKRNAKLLPWAVGAGALIGVFIAK